MIRTASAGLTLCLSLLLLAGRETPAATCDAPHLLALRQIGPIELGSAESDILRRYGKLASRVTLPREDQPFGLRVRPCAGVSIEAELGPDGRVVELRTSSPHFRTAKGAKVGDTLSSIVALHPDAAIHFGLEEGPWLSAVIPEAQGFFVFDVDAALVKSLDARNLDRKRIANLRASLYLAFEN